MLIRPFANMIKRPYQKKEESIPSRIIKRSFSESELRRSMDTPTEVEIPDIKILIEEANDSPTETKKEEYEIKDETEIHKTLLSIPNNTHRRSNSDGYRPAVREPFLIQTSD